MDPLTQGAVGAVFVQTLDKSTRLARYALIGAASGMAPDLDVLIRSSRDPLLALEYHRHFTHSFVFIPVGALLCSLLLYPLIARRRPMRFGEVYLAALVGYATHGLVDVCTSYGTQIFWPFSRYRASIDIVSVIDPLFTVPILVLIALAIFRHSKRYVAIALMWGFAYLLLGWVQNQRAEAIGRALAASRGHPTARVEAKPSFGNLIVWKTLYEYRRTFYVDAVRPGLSADTIWPGESIARLDLKRDFPWLAPESQQARDIERFRWFSSGYVAVYPEGSNRIADIRYSLLPHEINPLWSIELTSGAGPKEYVKYVVTRDGGKEAFPTLWAMITGEFH